MTKDDGTSDALPPAVQLIQMGTASMVSVIVYAAANRRMATIPARGSSR